jgi:hypothetical protein
VVLGKGRMLGCAVRGVASILLRRPRARAGKLRATRGRP